MKIAVSGHEGFVGSELIKQGCVPLDCDVTREDSVEFEISQVRPDVIIYAAGHTDVEWCEKHPDDAYKVNVQGVKNVTDHFGGIFIYLSSNYVFSGKNYFDYSENHNPSPINYYGYTKWGGELATDVSSFLCKRAIIIRTSKLFNHPFLLEDIKRLYNGETLEKTTIIKRSFLYLPHFVEGLMYAIQNIDKMPNLIHISGTDTLSYYQLWYFIAKELMLDTGLVKKRDWWLTDMTDRPRRGGLSVGLAKSLGIPLYSAYDGIKEMLQ